MPIDHELRSKGVGASEIAAVIGISPFEDAFGIYCRKLGLIKRPEPKPYQMRGKYFERGIMMWYSDVTGRRTQWFDQTIYNPTRPWQICSPDAWVLTEDPGYNPAVPRGIGIGEGWVIQGGADSKSVNWLHRDDWEESGTDVIPDYVAVQLHWSCSCKDVPFWDCAALLSMDDLRIYRIHRDPEVEAILLTEGERFWKNNVLARVAPPIGATETAREYLRQRFPRNIEKLRDATPEERDLLVLLKDVGERYDRIEKECTEIENRVKLAIGDADGIVSGGDKVTFKKDRDSIGPSWEAVAREIGLRLAFTLAACKEKGISIELPDEYFTQTLDQISALGEMQVTTRVGPRKLCPRWAKKINKETKKL